MVRKTKKMLQCPQTLFLVRGWGLGTKTTEPEECFLGGMVPLLDHLHHTNHVLAKDFIYLCKPSSVSEPTHAASLVTEFNVMKLQL